ncbi:MAG: DinB family protein, partial [Bacteroidota bacterium]
RLDYKPHPVNRSAYEIAEHILAHMVDFKIILENSQIDETLTFKFESPSDAGKQFAVLVDAVNKALDVASESDWDSQPVELKINGNSILTIPRSQMMWFFFFDIIHHRGQLSSYVRPMGGKNPAVYGFSADTI